MYQKDENMTIYHKTVVLSIFFLTEKIENGLNSSSLLLLIIMSALKLFGFGMSQPTRSVRLLLEFANIPYDFEIVDTFKGDHRKALFRKEFPNGLVPVIDNGGEKVEETANILSYLCNTYKLDQYYPVDNYNRSKVDFWLHWHHTNARISTRFLLIPKLYPKMPDAEGTFKKGQKQIAKSLKFIDTALSSRPFLADFDNQENLTIADLLVVSEFDQHLKSGFDLVDFTSYPNVSRWMNDIQSIDGYEKVYAPVTEAQHLIR